MKCKIIATGSCVPEQIISNDDLAKVVETTDEWIYTRTGIKRRRILFEGGISTLAVKAAEHALSQAAERENFSVEQLDMILVATSTSEHHFPSCACEVQAAIGAVNAVGMDLGSAACSGFVFALNTASAYIKAGIYKNILVIGADQMSNVIDWSDRSSCILFGDGAGAAIVSATEEDSDVMAMYMGSDGEGGTVLNAKTLYRSNASLLQGNEAKDSDEKGYTKMDGQDVFKFAVRIVPKTIHRLLDEAQITGDDIQLFVLHQANIRIIEAVAKRLGQPMEKFPSNLHEYGNTSAASVPILLDELNRGNRLKRGEKIVLAGFGAGLTWGGSLIRW